MAPCKFDASDETRRAKDRLETLLLEGLNSPETELTPEDWADIRKRALAELEEHKQQRDLT